MKKYVKFTGKIRDLKPDGWNFCKLFARNYRCYWKTCDGSEYGPRLYIWQHLGGYLEVDDFYGDSYLIVEQVAAGKTDEWSSIVNLSLKEPNNPEKDEKVFWTLFDRQEKRFLPYDSAEHREIKRKYYDTKSEGWKEWFNNEYIPRYRERNFVEEQFDMIKDLLDRGWIEVQEDKRKRL